MGKTLTVLERLEAVEQTSNAVRGDLDTLFEQFRGSMQQEMEIVQSVIEVLKTADPEFTNKVQAVIDTNKKAREQARADQEKKQLDQLVEAGVYKASDTITENSVLVGRVFDPEGNVRGVGRVQLNFSNLDKAVQPAFLGQSVGYAYEAPTKEKLEVLEIYDPAPAPAPVEAKVEADQRDTQAQGLAEHESTEG